MAIIKCKMCGGDLNVISNESVVECEYCGSRQTIPAVDNEKKLTLFARANRLRLGCEFDKAEGVYEAIVAEFPTEAEAYWGLVLCKYGIEYVDDPATGKKIPTCHRSSFSSIMEDSDFEQAQENADTIARKQYREEAKQIEELRKGIIAVSANEQPYDIFICYKETDENGSRTLDSVLAQEVYDALTSKGYRVFFSRISLEDKLGTEYEPYIFAALNSAKIMLVIGTDYEYFNAVWVKNEWSRYLKLMTQDKDKHLIPCYKGIDAYDMPKEFARLQAQDLGKLGAIQDLLRGVEKMQPLQKEEQEAVREGAARGEDSNVARLLKRVFMFLEDGDWDNADVYCERVLDADPENAEAYLGKLMAELQVKQRSRLAEMEKPFEDELLFKKVIRYGNEDLKNEMDEAVRTIRNRIAKAEEAERIRIAEAKKAELAIKERNRAKLKAFESKHRESRLDAQRKRFEEIKRQNDETNKRIAEIKTRSDEINKRIAGQRQIYAENERKIFGAGARAKKDALAEIRRLESEIDSLKKQKQQLPTMQQTLPQPFAADEHDSIGDYVKFGAYPQTSGGNDETPIEWLVLAQEGEKALLLSRYGLDAQPYNTEYVDITWEKCTLRTWLNDDFINRAFTQEEQSAILLTTVSNGSSQGYSQNSTNGGNDTQDKIFLLSYAEANKYLGVAYNNSNNTKSRVAPTVYAKAQGAYTVSSDETADGEAAGWWWLRSPGYDQSYAADVNPDGSLDNYYVDYGNSCIRPALWVNLDSGIF